MKIVICQGSPVIPNRALDHVMDTAEFFLSINQGSHYSEDEAGTEVVLKRNGNVASTKRIRARTIPSRGILRVLLLPWAHVRQLKTALGVLRQWEETRDACFIGRTWAACFVGLIARRMGRVRSVVYWVGDYYPVSGSLETRWLHLCYQCLHRINLRAADEVWYISRRLYEVHAKGMRRLTRARERVVACLYNTYPESQAWSSDRLHCLVFVGYVKRGQGLDVILPAVSEARTTFPDIHLDVIGSGPDLEGFRSEASEAGLDDCVRFHGFIEDEEEMRRIVGRSAVGFALYDRRLTPHAYYAVTSKAYLYAGCGIPVIINETAGSYEEFVRAGAGVSVDYAPPSVLDGILCLCETEEKHRAYRQAAIELAAGLQEDERVLREAFEQCAGGSAERGPPSLEAEN